MSFTMRRNLARSWITATHRPYHTSPTIQFPYKNSQDRESLKPGSNEGTKSGRDEDVAAQSDAAFNPKKTSPEAQYHTAGEDNETNPLNASGANQEFNKPMGDEKTISKTGAGKETRKGGRSGGQSPQKKGSLGRTG